MKSLIRLIPITLFTILLFGCNSDDIQIVKIEPILIAKGNLGAAMNISQQNFVVTDTESWSELMTKMDYRHFTDSALNIDFLEYQIIAIFDGLKPNNGFKIELDIETDSEFTIVTINSLSPEGVAGDVFSQPFHIVKIPVSRGSIIFQ